MGDHGRRDIQMVDREMRPVTPSTARPLLTGPPVPAGSRHNGIWDGLRSMGRRGMK